VAAVPIASQTTIKKKRDHLATKFLEKVVPQFKRLVDGFPPRRPGFKPESSHVGFVVDKAALGQVFSEYIRFPCQ
jgi:hypothetical protein